MSITETGSKRGGGPPWVKIVLILSLAANLVIAGLYAGHVMNRDEPKRGADNQIRWIIKLVPEARRDFTKEHFRKIRDDVRAARLKRVDHMAAIVDAIRVQPYTTDALEAALQARRDGSQSRQVIVQSHLVTLLNEFTDAERTEFADNLEMYLQKLRERQAERAGG
ncbi:MAG: periplasmic heavy metal sensor [Pseudomonadota bacterium]